MFDVRVAARAIQGTKEREKYGNPLTLDVRSASGEDTSDAYLSLYGQILIDAMRREVPEPGVSSGLEKGGNQRIQSECECVVDGIAWRYAERGDGLAVTGCSPVPAKLVVPPMLEGRPVTAIARRAFYDCGNVTAVELPDSVISIGDEAFRGTKLKNFQVPAALTELGESALLPSKVDTFAAPTIRSVSVRPGNATFFMEGDLLCQRGKDAQHSKAVFYAGSGGTYRIPDNVTEIGSMAFTGQQAITRLIVHDHIEYVEICGMYFSANLTRVVFEHAGPDGEDVEVAFPASSTGIMALRVGFSNRTIDPQLLSEVADGAIYNAKNLGERYMLMCRRLIHPLWLSEKRRESFIQQLTHDIGKVCVGLAEGGLYEGFASLALLGILTQRNFDDAIKALTEAGEVAAVNQLLAVRSIAVEDSSFDFEL